MADFEIHHLTTEVEKIDWNCYRFVSPPEIVSHVHVADNAKSCFDPIFAALPATRSVYVLCTDVDGQKPLRVGKVTNEEFVGTTIIEGGSGRCNFQFEIPKVEGSAILLVDEDKNSPSHMLVVREVK